MRHASAGCRSMVRVQCGEIARVVFQFSLTCSCQATRAARVRAAKCGAARCVPALDSARQRAIRSSVEVEFRVELVLERGERVGQ